MYTTVPRMPQHGKTRIVFDPAKDNPTLSKIFTCVFCLQLLWVAKVVLDHDLAQAQVLYTLLVSAGILVIQWAAQAFGRGLSTGILAGEPFNNPLAVTEDSTNVSKSMIKFETQTWQLLIHVVMSVIETLVLQQTAELAGGDLFEDPLRIHYYKQGNPDSVLHVYQIQLAIWIVTAVCHIWIFETQSDYFVMLAHHIATIALICMSWQIGLLRFGLAVLWVHDVSDIPIDLLKLTNYLKLEGSAGFFAVETSFVSCLISWMYLRLYLFPMQLVYKGGYCFMCLCYDLDQVTMGCPYLSDAQLAENTEHIAYLGQTNGEEYPYPNSKLIGVGAVVLLGALQLMHVWWYFLFLRILKGIVTTGNPHEAGRQQYEGDDEDAAIPLKRATSPVRSRRRRSADEVCARRPSQAAILMETT
eukprot:TRINITY_DN2652_c0_g1_i4.p1 TRINITY_DN2652_c0_g1~~TRINITY_DN2652_c0_g1_i4.p1  ORF type:complete len:415 (-),score=86.28 TRINITY_DN2652_c0_g1_i4:239-1483(-)